MSLYLLPAHICNDVIFLYQVQVHIIVHGTCAQITNNFMELMKSVYWVKNVIKETLHFSTALVTL